MNIFLLQFIFPKFFLSKLFSKLFSKIFFSKFFSHNSFSKFFFQNFFKIFLLKFFFQNLFPLMFFLFFPKIFFPKFVFWGLYSRCSPVYRDKTDSMYLCCEKYDIEANIAFRLQHTQFSVIRLILRPGNHTTLSFKIFN